MFADLVAEMFLVETQYTVQNQETGEYYSIAGKERNLINQYSSRLIKALRKELKVPGFTPKSIIKHFGGLSGYIEQDLHQAKNWIYFMWDISNPNFISLRYDGAVYQVNTTNLFGGILNAKGLIEASHLRRF